MPGSNVVARIIMCALTVGIASALAPGAAQGQVQTLTFAPEADCSLVGGTTSASCSGQRLSVMSVRKSRMVCPDACVKESYYVAARGILRFDLSAIPQGAQILSARLKLYATKAPGEEVDVSVHPVTTAWDPAGVTWTHAAATTPWNTPGGDLGPAAAPAVHNSGGTIGLHQWTMTGLVQSWVNEPFAEKGVVVRTNFEASPAGMEFASKEATVATQRPVLEVSYAPDTSRPVLFLHGVLYELQNTPLPPDDYDLAIDARSADLARADSGVARVDVFLNGALMHTATDDEPCTGSACEVDTDYELNARGFTGTRTIEVRATEQSGRSRSVSWAVDFSGVPVPLPNVEAPVAALRAPPETAASTGPGCPFATSKASKALIDERALSITHARRTTFVGSVRETTERYSGDRYRLTRCTENGELIMSRLVGPVDSPDGTLQLELGRTLPLTGNTFGTSHVDYGWPTGPESEEQSAAADAQVQEERFVECRYFQQVWRQSDNSWPTATAREFRIIRSSLPTERPNGTRYKASKIIRSIRRGANVWGRGRDRCSWNTVPRPLFFYDGEDSDSTATNWGDRVNTVDFANRAGDGSLLAGHCPDPPGSTIVIGCEHTTANDENVILETDIRFNRSHSWWVDARPVNSSGRFGTTDLWSLAAHEFGHSYEAAHPEPREDEPEGRTRQIMHDTLNAYDERRYLGLSDIIGACSGGAATCLADPEG